MDGVLGLYPQAGNSGIKAFCSQLQALGIAVLKVSVNFLIARLIPLKSWDLMVDDGHSVLPFGSLGYTPSARAGQDWYCQGSHFQK